MTPSAAEPSAHSVRQAPPQDSRQASASASASAPRQASASPSSYYVGPHVFRPHPLAPHFSSPREAELLFRQLVSELSSPHSSLNAEAVALARELGFVSLWFFLVGILSTTGPYEKLVDPVSIDMCNFRASDAWMRPGAHAAAFIPRGFYKSTVFTHGGITWDLLRNPEERIVLVNAIFDKASEFFHQVERNFDSCDLFKQLYPEWVPGKLGKASDKELILPNRRRAAPEPNLKPLGLTGASEGGHYTLITMDDLIGLDSVDSNRQATTVMETAKKWFRTNRRALRVDRRSRVVVVATRYAMDDCYEDIYSSCRQLTGYSHEDIIEVPSGEWDIYYRLHEEDGIFIRPDIMDKAEYERLLKEDYWAAIVNYGNAPKQAGLTEFGDALLGSCELIWDGREERYWIRRLPDPNFPIEESEREISLDSCDVIVTTDLAATEKKMDAKTCRTSIAMWATDSGGNRYRLWSRVGFFSIDQTFDYLFEVNKLFHGYIRTTIIEANAFQKIVAPVLRREQEWRQFGFPVWAVNASGDKKARIRAALGQTLPKRLIWLGTGASKEFIEELKVFPMSDKKLDVLDESEKAITYGVRPASDEERVMADDEEEERGMGILNAVGY